MSWDTIVADPEFQALEPDRKQKIANNYFAKNFESDNDFLSLPEEKRFKIKSNFESTLKLEPSLPSRGLFMDVATAPIRGLVNAAETYGRAARTIDPEGGRDFVRDIGTKVVGLTEKVREKAPYIFKPSRESERGYIRKAITEGTESFAHSLVTGLPGAAVGAVGGIPGMIAGYAASGGALFGLAEYDQFLEEASNAINERKDLTPEEKTALIEKAKPLARKSALVEGGFEFASDLAEGLTMKIGKPFTQLAKGSIRSYLTTTPKQVLLNMAKVASIETPTEMTQAYLETGLRQKAGIDTGLTPKQAAAEVVGPTLFSSVLFGALGSRFDYKQKQKIRNALVDSKVDIAEREGAINAVAPILSKVNKPFAETWTLNALNSVAQRKPIDIDIPFEKIEKPKATGLKLEQPEKAEVPKFDATPDIKTTGQGLKIEPVIEQPVKTKPIVSHEEDIIVKGEKPVTLEKPISKPITEGLSIEKEIPVTLEPQPEKGVIASEETEGQEAQGGLPLKPVSFVSVEDARSWIKQKSKEYGGRNQFLGSKEYETAYPEVKRVFDKEKKEYITKGEQALIESRVNIGDKVEALAGGFGGQTIVSGTVISKGGIPYVKLDSPQMTSAGLKKEVRWHKGWKATYVEALEPEQGTSPQTKGLPTGEAAPVVSKEPWQMTSKEYYGEEKQIKLYDVSKIDPAELPWTGDLPVSRDYLSNVSGDGKLSETKIVDVEDIESTEKTSQAQVDELKEYIKDINNDLPPIVVERDAGGLFVVDGHNRFQAAKELGYTKIPVKEYELPADISHEQIVKQSLSEGKPVPPEVLKDYPELQADVPFTKQFKGNVNFQKVKDIYETQEPKIGDTFVSAGGKEWKVTDIKKADTKGGLKKPATEIELSFTGGERKTLVYTEKIWDKPSIKKADVPGAQAVTGLPEKAAPEITTDIYNKPVEEIFIRETTRSETKSLSARRVGLNKIPTKEGYEIIFKPYGEKGAGFYYRKYLPAQGDVDKPISVVSKAVGDNTQQVIIKDGKITVISKSGKKKVGSFEIEITKWAELEKSFGNPNYNKKKYISELNKQAIPGNYSGEYEGSPFISRIEDAQISAINEAYKKYVLTKSLEVMPVAEHKEALKTETPTIPIPPIEAKIKKGIPEGESLTSQQTLAEQLHTAQPELTEEEAQSVTTFMVDPLAKALEITSEEVASQYIKQIKASAMAELEGRDITYQPSGLPVDVVSKIETSLISNVLDDSISVNALRRYGKPHFVTISSSTPKQEAWTRLRKVLIDNPKGYDIVGGRTILTDREYLEGKRNKVQYQGNRGAIEFTKDGKAIIHILENADKSTFIHEMFHLYVEVMKRTPKLKAQLKILETWIGKPVDKWTVADNEKVAKGGEKYLWEGNAPTSALKAVFERFKTWLREVYKTAKSLDIKLSDDVRKMWDEWFGGGKPEIEIKEAVIPVKAEVVTKEIAKIEEIKPVKSSIGTLDNIDTVALSDIFKSEIDRGTPLNKLLVKRIVAGKLGILVGDLIPEKGYKHKAVEEAYEYAIVKKGREIAQSDMSVDEKFEATKKLYAQQLNLSERTSSSIEKQQYSTPLPLAMSINEYLSIDKNTTVYEPTAGNGILLIGANPKKTVTNELATDYRQTHLKDQGFSTIQGDAMTFIKDTGMNKSFNTVVMNPPFGNAEVKLFDNYRVRKLEHQIALESLKAMKDNGNAAIIIGGHNFEHGKMTESDRIFLNYLYSHYIVTHNIDINGDVYRRMGTSFPIRLLTIEGRKATPDNKFAPTEQSQVESANTFDDVRNRLGKPIQKEMEAKREDIGKEPIITRLPGKEGRGVEGITEGRQKGDEPTRGVRDIAPGPGVSDTGLVEQPGYSKDIVGDIVREERGRGRTGTSPGVARGEGVRSEELPGQLPLPSKQSRLADANIQVPHVPKSKGRSGGNVIPKNLAEPIAKVLQKIEDTYGDIDNFIQKELQYKTREDLFNALSAEQIEDATVIISNIKNGKSTILGGQTGIGKGRTLSAIIRYANLQGIKPIFFTEKPNLFSDIYRDLVDIKHIVKPFVLHSSSNSTILDAEGNKVFKPSFVGESKTNMIKDPIKEMENFDMLITTYDQINKENKQRGVLRMLAQDNIIILDEAHKAAGASNTGEFMSKLLEGAKVVVYSSATYAKRPDNMGVYHKTDIGKTGLSVEGLTSAIKLGGIPLQQWVASALAEGGQYTRTELDYSGTNLDIILDTKNEALHTKQSDGITSTLRDIVKFDREKLKIIKEMDKEAVKEGKRTTGEDSTAAGVTSSNFSSVVHNMVGQLLLSFRADAAVDKAIAAAKEGRKPVITLMNTMEAFLSNTVAEGNVSIGDPIGFSFKDVLKKALKGTLRYTEISPGGDRFKKVLKLEELPDSAQAIYQDIESKINSLETSLPSSPIDYIKSKLVKAGYTVGEITNRKLYVDYSKAVPTLEARGETERRDRNSIINAFNSGKTKILIFNASGATGISLHASEKFTTAKEQRELLIVQPQLNIDTFKQAMGRVFRKGQVSKPRFTMIQTALPAEIRPTVILQKKLASLNANTTANKESSAGLKDVPDMMNSYGDSVVSAYLKQNPEINSMLGDPLGIEADKENAVDAMQKVTGKVALLPVQIQRQFYDDIEMAYKELIEHLDQIGENNLHTKEYNFQSKTLEKQITNQGKDESNPFASSTYLEKISVKVLKKPFTKAKIEELIKDSLKGKEAEVFNEELLSKIKEVTDQYNDTLEGELVEKRKEEIQYDVNLIDYAFKKFKIGYSYSIPIIEDVYTPAVLVDIKHSKTSGNPAAPSKVHLVFAAAPPYQIYKTSLSRKEFISHADSTGEGIPSEWDDLIPKEVRENRHVITGNLLQGFQRLGERAETINYTTESGEVKAGILLPRSTDINSLKEGGTTVGAKEAFNYLQSHNYIESPDKEVTVRVSKETVTINVPKSKSDGAKYYLNKPLLSLLEVEFSSFGNSMRSHVEIEKLLPLLETLEQETSTRFSIPAKEVAPSETVTEKMEGKTEEAGKIFFQEAHKESFITNVVDKFSNWNEEKKAYKEAVDNGLIKEDISDDFRSKVKQWVSFPRTIAKKYPIFKRYYDRAEKYFEDVDNYATTMGNTVKPYMDSSNQETVNKLLIDARLNKQYAYSKEELQKAGHSEEVIKEYLSVVNAMNQGLHYITNMLNRSGNNIEEIYTFVSRVKGMKNLLKPYKDLENKDNINKVLSKTVWGKRVFRKQELIDMGLTEEERLAYNSITKLMFKNSNYVPFKRYGDWFVAVNDAEGKLVEYSFHESHKEMRAEALAMVEKYPGNKVTSGNVKKLATEAYQNMPVSILTMLKEFDEQLDTEFSKVYANITGRGFPLHLIESKKILGFEKDLSKSISDYILGISKWMASKEARHDFSKMFVEKDAEGKLLLDPRKQAQLYGYTDRYVNYILGNSKEGSKFRQFMFRYYLGGVVKSAMLNFTQSLTTTLPTSAKYIAGSIIRRSRLMADAIKTASIPIDKLKTINPQLAEALQKALKDGKISEQMVKMLRGEVYGRKLNKLDKILSYMFEFAEQSNRKIAFIMAYNEAITNGVKTKGRKGGYQVLGHEEAVKFAEDFVDETQFVYSKLNKSELMRGWKAPLFTFRVFSGSYLSLLKGMILEGEWKALSESLGVMLLLGGLAAFPGLKEIEKALELMGYDPKKGIKKKFGQWGDLSLHGVLYPLGIDLSGALGTIEIVPGDIQQGIVPAVGGLILGVPMDIPKRMGRAWTLLTKNKDVYRAVEAVMPEAIRNPMVAVRWMKEGEAKSATYEPITKVGGFDTALKFLGIQPATLSKAYEREHSEAILRNINYSEGYNWRIAKALYKKDSNEFKDILEEIRKHNAKIGKAIAGGDKEAVRKYILPTRQGIQRNLLKMVSPQASELKSMPKVLRPAYREIQEVMK